MDVKSGEHYINCQKVEYDKILNRAILQNPLPPVNPKTGKTKKGKIRALIDRLIDYKTEILRFADNFIVPFSNNQAEQDLRMIKMKIKVAGCLRTFADANAFLNIKSVLSTALSVVSLLSLPFFYALFFSPLAFASLIFSFFFPLL